VRPLSPAPTYVWIEGEAGTSKSIDDKKINRAGWGHPEFLSGDKWLQLTVDEKDVDTVVLPKGSSCSTALMPRRRAATRSGTGSATSMPARPFSWRIDNGDWRTVKPTDLTSDLMELATWTEVAWLKLSDGETLAAGPHTLHIRLQKSADDKGKDEPGPVCVRRPCADSRRAVPPEQQIQAWRAGTTHPARDTIHARRTDAEWRTDTAFARRYLGDLSGR
jgi:hypothetical protein